MTYPNALVVILVFFTGLTIGYLSTYSLFVYCFKLHDFRMKILSHIKKHWASEWFLAIKNEPIIEELDVIICPHCGNIFEDRVTHAHT